MKMLHAARGTCLAALFLALISPGIPLMRASAAPSPVEPVDLDLLRNPRLSAPLHPLMRPGATRPTGATAQDGPADFHPRERPFTHDSQRYALHLAVQVDDASLTGILDYTFTSKRQGLRSISLDAYDMRIDRVTDRAGTALPYSYDGRLLVISLPSPLGLGQQTSIAISYAALHSDSFLTTGPDPSSPQRMPAAYTFTQPEGSQTWFPCVDSPADKALLDITVDVASPHKVLSNGRLVAVSPLPGKKNRYHYRMDTPIAPYLISLAVGPYEVLPLGEYKGKPLSLWTPPALRQAAWRETSDTSAMMAAISDFTGTDYPFDSYATSVAPAWTTSMEHQTATTMGAWRINGDGSGEGVVAHELAHQWFGDWVTCERWSELWLNEGFATYLPAIYFAATGKNNDVLAYEDYWRSGYLKEAASKVRPLSSPTIDWQDLFDSHAYEKGALVLKLMNNMASRLPPINPPASNFTLALQHYLQTHGGGNVRHQDLQAALEEVSGRSWQVFFDQWVRSPGHPILAVDWQASGKELIINIRQEQTASNARRRWKSFSFPLDLEVIGEAGQRQLLSADIYGNQQQLRLTLPFTAQAINLDPEWQIPFQWHLSEPRQRNTVEENFSAIWGASPSERSRIYAMRQILKHRPQLDEHRLAELISNDPSLYLQVDAITLLTQRPAHHQLVKTLLAKLKTKADHRDYDRIIKDGVALTEAWLVATAPEAPSPSEQDSWQASYMSAATTNQRAALLSMLKTASLPTAQRFAFERLQESRWVTRDRAALIDVLTRQELSQASWDFILPGLRGLTYLWFHRLINNLIAQGVDDQRLVAPLIEQAKTYRYTGGRTIAIKLLGKQRSSQNLVCPALTSLSEDLARRPERHSEVRHAAAIAQSNLGCPTTPGR